MDIVSLEVQEQDGWLFKVSESEHRTCIIAYNPLFYYSVIRFFVSDYEAQNWIEYLIMASYSAIENNKNQ